VTRSLLFCILLACALGVQAQDITQYGLFKLSENEIYWKTTYKYPGAADSLRPLVVQMLKSKFFTFNVIRNEAGYNGEIRHYKVDAKKYGRTYMNTPRMYWEGEWTGKFIVEVLPNEYRVTVYALYYEKIEKSTGYYKTEKSVKGRYFDAVTRKKGKSLLKSEFSNLDLISRSLQDEFDIRNTVLPP